MPFEFTVYEDNEIIEEGSIAAQTSVSVGNPETIELEAGTYTIVESPAIEGYILQEPYTFTLEPGEGYRYYINKY